MSAEQALQILAQATENLPATRAQHTQISQALATLQAMIASTRAQLSAVPKEEKKK